MLMTPIRLMTIQMMREVFGESLIVSRITNIYERRDMMSVLYPRCIIRIFARIRNS